MTTPDPAPAKKVRLSVSRIETYDLCPMKWYFQEIVSVPVPDTASKELGTEVHGLCEVYLQTGKEPHDGKPGVILRAGLHLLPPPGTVRVEEWTRLENIGAHPLWRDGVSKGIVTLEMEDLAAGVALNDAIASGLIAAPPGTGDLTREPYLSGATLNGKIDMYLPRLSDLPEQMLEARDRKIMGVMGFRPDGLIYVNDLKTTGDFKWAKTAVQLATNTQMMTYSYVVGLQSYEREGVRWNTPTGAPQGALVEHVQVRTKGQPMAKRERAFVRWDQIEKAMGVVDKTAREMLKLACKGEAEVTADPKYARPTGCSAYGGCPFQEICNFSPAGRVRGKPVVPAMTARPSLSSSSTTSTTKEGTMTKAGNNKAALFGDKGGASAGKGAVATTASTKSRTPSKGTGVGAKAPVVASKGTGAKAPVVAGKIGKLGTVPEKGAGSALNPPDAAPSQPPVEPEAGVNLLRENLDLADGALAIGHAKKLIAKLGCDFDAVIAEGGFVIEDDVVYPPEAVAEGAGEESGETGEPETGDVAVGEDGIPYDADGNACYVITEIKPGQFRPYTPDGTAITDPETGAFAFGSWEEANNVAWKTVVGEAEVLVEDVEGDGAALAEDADASAYNESKAYKEADAQAKVAIDAFVEALTAAEGVLTVEQVNEVYKKACNVQRVHAKTRDGILAVGVEAGAFLHAEGGGLTFGGPEPEAPATAGADDVVETEQVDAFAGVPADGAGLVILVDALALGQPMGDLSAHLAQYEDVVAEQGLDVRGKGADYCKGGKAVASRVLVAQLSTPLTGWWAVSSRHPYVEEVLAVLSRQGAVVVRGVR